MDIDLKKLDILKEVGSIGSGQAASSLSAILNKKIDVSLGQTSFVKMNDFTSLIGGPNQIILVVHAELVGEISGIIQIVFKRDYALRLIDLVLGKPKGTTRLVDEMEQSAFSEIGNILFGAYLSSLSNMLGIKVLFSATNTTYDLAGAIMDFSLIKVAANADKILTIDTKLIISDEAIDGNIIVLFKEESLKKIISVIEDKYLKE